MKWICEKRHTCNSKCDAANYRHHDYIWQHTEGDFSEEYIDEITNSLDPNIKCEDLTKIVCGNVTLLRATLSPIRLCKCNGPCMREPVLEPCEA